MRDPDAIRPHEAASLRARPTLAPEERPPDAVELTLSTITVPEGSEVELLQIATRRPGAVCRPHAAVAGNGAAG